MNRAPTQLKTYIYQKSDNDGNGEGDIKLISALPSPGFPEFWSSSSVAI